jgi:iron uptake system EfeUOB component EfeO/EfeM
VRRLPVALLALGLGLAACSSGDDGDGTTAKPVDGPTIEVTLNDEGCHPRTIATFAGPTNFHVTNKGSGAVSRFGIVEGEKVVAELKKVEAGADGNLAVTLKTGSYATTCPGGSAFAAGTLKVTDG